MSEEELTPVQPFPQWDTGDANAVFPAGNYLCVLGGLTLQYSKEEASQEPEAITNDIWILKYLGDGSHGSKSIVRIKMEDGKPIMDARGVKVVERYPNPKIKPNMAWRPSAFFGKFEGTITEVTIGGFDANGDMKKKKVVDWQKVQLKYGTVFQCSMEYNKAKNGKSYRNIDYESVTPTAHRISADDMHKIEEMYNSLKAQDKAGAESPPPKAEDLPF